jgi:hypothetical protein
MILQAIISFLITIIQTEHAICEALKDYRSPLEWFHIPFYKNIMKSKWSFYILRYLHFFSNVTLPDKSGKDYDMLGEVDLSVVGSVMLMLNFTVPINI